MKYLKKEEKRRFPWLLVLLCVIAVLAVSTILLQSKDTRKESAGTPVATVATVAKTENTEETVVPTTTEPEVPPISIETPYCTLYYPGQWAEGLETEITGEEFDTTVSFYGTVSEEKHLLFSLYFGGAEGFPVGVLETKDGVMLDVTMEIAELELNSRWSQEETDRLCAMQEALNDVLGYLGAEPSFVPAA